jgi:REP element-mobilizing transposase RayT
MKIINAQKAYYPFHSLAAYCLMPNHYHILLKTPEGNISRAMRHINGMEKTYRKFVSIVIIGLKRNIFTKHGAAAIMNREMFSFI